MLKRSGLALALFFMLAVATACGGFEAGQRAAGDGDEPESNQSEVEKNQGSPEESPDSSADGVRTVGSSSDQADATGDPRLQDVILTNEEGSSDPVETFRTRLDDRVYVAGDTVGLTESTELSVSWIAENVPEYGNEEALSGEEVGSETDYVEGDRPFEFWYEPGDLWAPGEYRVEVSLDGVLAKSLDFNVVEPVLPMLARPEQDLPNAPPAAPGDIEPTNLQFIVDASASMNEPVDGTHKMEAARNALQTLVSALSEDTGNLDVGLRAYSHREASEGDASCEDTELLAPIEGVKKPELRERIDSLQAVGGRTPMANTVGQSAEDFPSGGEQNVVVLVSDGKENCTEDPVGEIEDAAAGADLTVHVVGFDIGEAAARTQLQDIAEATGGVYVDAQTPDELTDALRQIAEEQVEILQVRSGAGELVFRTPDNLAPDTFQDLVLLDETGTEVVQELGFVRDEDTNIYQLPPAVYIAEFSPTSIGEPLTFRIEIGAVQETVLRMGALRIRAPGDTQRIYVEDQATGRTAEGFGSTDRNFLDGPRVVPPGTYNVLLQATATSDPTTVAEDVEVEPNQIVEVTP